MAYITVTPTPVLKTGIKPLALEHLVQHRQRLPVEQVPAEPTVLTYHGPEPHQIMQVLLLLKVC